MSSETKPSKPTGAATRCKNGPAERHGRSIGRNLKRRRNLKRKGPTATTPAPAGTSAAAFASAAGIVEPPILWTHFLRGRHTLTADGHKGAGLIQRLAIGTRGCETSMVPSSTTASVLPVSTRTLKIVPRRPIVAVGV